MQIRMEEVSQKNFQQRATGDIKPISAQTLFPIMKEVFDEGKSAAFTVTGMSMWPFLCHGRDRVVVEACDPSELKRGDIVLFRTGRGNYLLHRVTGLRSGQFQTTGDGNCFRDGWFDHACLRARVSSLVRKGRRIDCRAAGWRAVSESWMALFPVRKPLLRLLTWLAKARRIGRNT